MGSQGLQSVITVRNSCRYQKSQIGILSSTFTCSLILRSAPLLAHLKKLRVKTDVLNLTETLRLKRKKNKTQKPEKPTWMIFTPTGSQIPPLKIHVVYSSKSKYSCTCIEISLLLTQKCHYQLLHSSITLSIVVHVKIF